MNVIRKFLFVCGLMVSFAFGAAAQITNGFYEQSERSTAQMVTSQDGVLINLGEKYEPSDQKISMWSQNNANSYFSLELEVPFDKKLETSRKALIVDGRAYRASGTGSWGQETSSIFFQVQGKDQAAEVAKYFSIEPTLRRHPGHLLVVSFTPAKEQFAPGEDVKIVLSIKNVSSVPIAFMQGGKNRGARDNQYSFSARYEGKSIADVGDGNHRGGVMVHRVIKPGETFENTVSLSKWFAFNKPGVYEVLGTYSMDFNGPKNNKEWQSIWQDYATAQFFINIKPETADIPNPTSGLNSLELN